MPPNPVVGADASTDPQPTYTFRPILFSCTETWRLQEHQIEIQRGRRRLRIPYGSVVRVCLSQTHGPFVCRLWTRGGRRVALVSRSFRSLGEFEDHGSYAGFVRALHGRLRPHAAAIRFDAGVPGAWLLARILQVVAVAVLLGAVLAFVWAVLDDRPWPWLLLAAVLPVVAAVPGIEAIARRRSPQYAPDAVPADLLPG